MHSDMGLLPSLRSLASKILRRVGVFKLIVFISFLALFFLFPVKNFKRLSNSDLEQIVNSEVFRFFSNSNKNFFIRLKLL